MQDFVSQRNVTSNIHADSVDQFSYFDKAPHTIRTWTECIDTSSRRVRRKEKQTDRTDCTRAHGCCLHGLVIPFFNLQYAGECMQTCQMDEFIPNKDYRFTSLRKMALPTKLVSYVGWAPSTRKACSMLAKGQSYGTDSNITHGLPGCIFNWLQCLASWQQRCNTAPRRSMMANAHTISDLSQCSVGINCFTRIQETP